MSATVILPQACPEMRLYSSLSFLVSSGKKSLCAHIGLLIAVTFIFLASTSLSLCAATNNTSSYQLEAEDVVTVTVLGHSDLSGEYYIPADGFVNLPIAGRIHAAGKSLDQFAASVKQALDVRLIDPDVSVSLKSAHANRVYLLGSVSRSGYYDAKPGWHMTEAIAAAGGVLTSVEPSHCKVTILRASDGSRQSVNLVDVISGNANANLPVENGDVLTVDDGEMPIYIVGRVGNAGLYRVQRDGANIAEVLAKASGTLADAALTNVTISHLSGAAETVNIAPAILEGKEFPKVKLEPGDMITVPESKSRVATLGWVKTPGLYNYQDGKEIVLSDALALAGGLDNKRASVTGIAIVRIENGKEQRIVVDYSKFLKTGDITQNPKINPGDVVYVPESNKMDWDFITRAAVAIASLANPWISR